MYILLNVLFIHENSYKRIILTKEVLSITKIKGKSFVLQNSLLVEKQGSPPWLPFAIILQNW
jgi:hypothetical protein